MSAGIRRWIFSALGVLALCLLMTGLDARAADLFYGCRVFRNA